MVRGLPLAGHVCRCETGLKRALADGRQPLANLPRPPQRHSRVRDAASIVIVGAKLSAIKLILHDLQLANHVQEVVLILIVLQAAPTR